MKTPLQDNRFGRWPAIMVGVLVVLVTVGGALVAADPGGEAVRRSQSAGEARISVQTDKVIARVGQQEISLTDFVEAKAQVEANLAFMQEEISKGTAGSGDVQAQRDLMEKAGIETVALAGLIQKAALFQMAVDRGLLASESELQAAVDAQRELWAKGGPAVAQGDAYVQVVGEERFWSEIMPAWQAQALATQKLYVEITKNVDPMNHQQVWKDTKRIAVQNAPLDLADADAVSPATVKGVIDYVDQWAQLLQEETR